MAALLIAPAAAYAMRLGQLPVIDDVFLWFMIPFALTGCASIFVFGLNRGAWRYASLEDLIAILKCVGVAVMAGSVGAVIGGSLDGFPRSLLPLSLMAALALMVGPRLLYRILKEKLLTRWRHNGSPSEAVLLYGYCDGAANFIRHSRSRRGRHLVPVGVIAHRNNHANRTLLGVSVLGQLGDLRKAMDRVRRHHVSKILICLPDLPAEDIRRIVEAASDCNLTVMKLPSYSDLLDPEDTPAPRAVKIEDLLGRDNINVDMASIAAHLVGKRVLVTGAGGSIGSEICLQAAVLGIAHITLVDSGEYNLYRIDGEMAQRHPQLARSTVLCDVRDRAAVSRLIEAERPALIFHAAALKHVPLVEMNVSEGLKTNVIGTRNVADAALANGCEAFVMISTDKAVNPTNVMGASKRFAEAYVQLLDRNSVRTRFMTVRFGNVLGSAGSVVPLFTRQIASGGPITVTHPDMERYFMTIPEAVRLVIAASVRGLAAQADRGRIFVLDMGKPVRIVDLARRMIQLSGLKVDEDIKIEFTGLRPGEKLYEEIFAASERLMPTDHSWLQVAGYRPVSEDRMAAAIRGIEAAVTAGDAEAGVHAIRMIVPEFVRQDGPCEPPQEAKLTPIALLARRTPFRLNPIDKPVKTGIAIASSPPVEFE